MVHDNEDDTELARDIESRCPAAVTRALENLRKAENDEEEDEEADTANQHPLDEILASVSHEMDEDDGEMDISDSTPQKYLRTVRMPNEDDDEEVSGGEDSSSDDSDEDPRKKSKQQVSASVRNVALVGHTEAGQKKRRRRNKKK